MRRGPIILFALLIGSSIMVPILALYWLSARGPGASPGGLIRMLVVFAVVMIGLAGLAMFIQARQASKVVARPTARRWAGLAASALIYPLLMAGLAMVRGGSVAARVVEALPLSVAMFGMGMLGMMFMRVGEAKYCAACGYELSPEIEKEGGPESRCPECGRLWMVAGGTVQGRTRINKPILAIGLLLTIVPFGLMFGRISGLPLRMSALRVLPNSSLIAEVTAATGGFTTREWAVLGKRSLSPAEKQTLAEGLLELRDRRQYLSREAEAWMETEVLAGRLPAAVCEQYFRGMLRVWIDAPDRAKAGEPLSIGLGSDHRGTLYTPGVTTLQAFVCFNGFQIGDNPDRLARATSHAYAISYGRVSDSFGMRQINNATGPVVEIIPGAGKVVIKGDYWLIVAPPARGGGRA